MTTRLDAERTPHYEPSHEVHELQRENERLQEERDLLKRELRQSYERNHSWTHGYEIAFADCDVWECKNRREKLAEWGIPLDHSAALSASGSREG